MLMGVAVNITSDRFANIQVVVPLVDCLTPMLMSGLPPTAVEWDEWGDPYRDPEVYDYTASHAPYEDIPADVKYPKIPATTSLNNIRVLYMEPAKWVAGLREVIGGESGQFLPKTEMSVGHGGVSGHCECWRQTALEYARIVHTADAVE